MDGDRRSLGKEGGTRSAQELECFIPTDRLRTKWDKDSLFLDAKAAL